MDARVVAHPSSACERGTIFAFRRGQLHSSKSSKLICRAVLNDVFHMITRSPKRNICRYFATSGTCFYGDQCQFQHVWLAGGALPPTHPSSAGERAPGRIDGFSVLGEENVHSEAPLHSSKSYGL